MPTCCVHLDGVPDDLREAVEACGFAVGEDTWIRLSPTPPDPGWEGVWVGVVSDLHELEEVVSRDADHALVWPADRARIPAVLRAALRSAERLGQLVLYREAFRNAPVWQEISSDEIVLLDVSRGFEEATGYTAAEAVGRTPAELFRGGTHGSGYYHAVETELGERGRWQGDLLGRRRDGSLAVTDALVVQVWRHDELLGQLVYKREAAIRSSRALRGWLEDRVSSPWLLLRRIDGAVLECSASVNDLLGLSREELLGSDLAPFGVDVSGVANGQRRASDTWIGARALQVVAHGRLVGDSELVLVVLTDITTRKEEAEELDALARQLANARDQALAADRAKSAFLAGMSHDLRTPLNAVIGYSELLEERIEDEEDLADLGRVRAAGVHLLGLVDQVLDLARIESGTVEVNPERLPACELLEEVAAHLRLRAARRGQHIVIDCRCEEVLADRQRLQQILINLLTNAVKYAVPGPIVLGADDGRVWVRDQGPGMTEAQQRTIFEPFQRLQTGGDGFGLGLALCRRLARSLGGDLQLDSTPGVGSCFVLRLAS